MYKTEIFNFILPQELIAQKPREEKEQTPMLYWKNGKINDQKIGDLLNILQPGDLLVFNDAKVINAKFIATNLRNKQEISFNLDQPENNNLLNIWQALCKPAKKVEIGDILHIKADFFAKITNKKANGFITIKFINGNLIDDNFSKLNYNEEDSNKINNYILAKINQFGQTPLPPYIENNQQLWLKYQNAFAKDGLAVASPTAGLHFTNNFINELAKKGVEIGYLTLNVGAGTFLPVKAENISEHQMHCEFFTIDNKLASQINLAKKEGRRVVAVGTTVVRALESAGQIFAKNLQKNHKIITKKYLESTCGKTTIFIYPGYNFLIIDAIITNFHLPKSTLLMLVSAFTGIEQMKAIYQHAIAKKYQFYSFGDASFLAK